MSVPGWHGLVVRGVHGARVYDHATPDDVHHLSVMCAQAHYHDARLPRSTFNGALRACMQGLAGGLVLLGHHVHHQEPT